MTDSAGLTIYSYGPGTPDTIRALRPDLVIGDDTRAEYQFYNASSVQLLHGGEMLVVNGGTNELRIYDAQGRYNRSLGGEGQASGEFELLSNARRSRGDTIVAYDFISRRLSAFSTTGGFVRSRSLPDVSSTLAAYGPIHGYIPPWLVGVLSDGKAIIEGPTIYPQVRVEDRRVFAVADLSVHSLTEDTVDLIGRFAAIEFVPAQGKDRIETVTPMFPANIVRAAGASRIVVSEHGQSSFSIFDPTGERIAFVREVVARRPVTAEHRSRHTDRVRHRLASEPWLLADAFADSVPAFDAALVDDHGRLWARRYETARDEPEVWRLFPMAPTDPGVTLILPGDFNLTDIREGNLAGITVDDLGVQRAVRIVCGQRCTSP